MIETIRNKVKALVGDFIQTDTEVFTYENSEIFTLQEENIEEITEVSLNGTALGSGDYSFDSSTNKITISISGLSSSDVIEVIYTYYKYSDTEIDGYIKGAIVWMSIFSNSSEKDYEVENGDIYPTPTNAETDLMAVIASILIKPNYSQYNLPNLRVTYPETMSKEQKIERLCNQWSRGLGINGVLNFD